MLKAKSAGHLLRGDFDLVAPGLAKNKNTPEKKGGGKVQALGNLRTFADFFCGVGGFHVAADSLGLECVFACDIDEAAREVYKRNFSIEPHHNITKLCTDDVPDHDCFFAGFPCQPFSIIGKRAGFTDDRNGSLFFEAARIIAAKRPSLVVLENVRQLATADGGKVLQSIITILEAIGYCVDWRILNALDFGLPQKRERVLIVGTLEPFEDFKWPEKKKRRKSLSSILEPNPDKKHFVSDRIRKSRFQKHKSKIKPAIWHENKGGNVSSHPFSCALRAGASYNYLLVNGERRLTSREMFRLQGFPDSFKLADTDHQARKQAGNAVPVPMVKAVIKRATDVIRHAETSRRRVT